MSNVITAQSLYSGTWPEEALVTCTTDLSEAYSAISRVYCPHRFQAQDPAPTEPVIMHSLQGRHIGVSHFAYGTPIHIASDEFNSFFMVLTTAKGSARISSAAEYSAGEAGLTVIASPQTRWSFDYSGDNEQIVTCIDAKRLTDFAVSMLGHSSAAELKFELQMRDPQLRRRWLLELENLRGLLDPATPERTRSMLLPRSEEMLMLMLLLDQPGSLSDLGSVRSESTPACLRRALAYIEENLDGALTLESIAAAACCSIRSLQRVFRTCRDISVTLYVKERRLRRVRDELLNATPAMSVTSVALRWGFNHLGQFAADYRAMHGEQPSDTLRRGQDRY
ncbi:MAG TPA: AraC family transcriptional regulator [Pseudoduganella sp.]